MKKTDYLHLLEKLISISSRCLHCMKRSRIICSYWSVVKTENKMLLVVCDCCDLSVKILVDLKRQGSFVIVKRRAASLALLLEVWERSLLCTLSWWLICCEICKWHSHGDTRDMALSHTRATTQLPAGSRGSWVILRECGTSAGPHPALGSPSPGDAKTLAPVFPVVPFYSQGDSLATMLSITHLSGWIFLLSGMLWHPLLKILLVYLNAFTSLGEA